MGQTSYGYGISKGIAGGLYDISTHAIETRKNEELKLRFGCGVVSGTSIGKTIKLPVQASVAGDFEGVVINGLTQEQTMEGDTIIAAGRSVGVLKYGNVWVAVGSGAEVTPNADVYLITGGAEAGMFTTLDDTAVKVAIKASFIDTASDGIAPMRLFNEKN